MEIAKKNLRKLMKDLRHHYPMELRGFHGGRISARLSELCSDRGIHVIHTFLPLPEEIDIIPFIMQSLSLGKQVIVPQTKGERQLDHWVLEDLEHLAKGAFNTQYPINAAPYRGTYELIIVPGLAFDQRGNRLGFGAGYYDSFLGKHPDALKVGVGLPFQLIEQVPVEKHDIALDLIFC